MKFLLILIMLQTCNSKILSNTRFEDNVNTAINQIIKDSLFVDYIIMCSENNMNSFNIKQEYSFSFSSTYTTHKSEFDSLLKQYLISKTNPFLNQRCLREKDSLRYLSEKENLLDINILRHFNEKSPNYLFIDIVDNYIFQINIETRKCPYKGIKFIFLIENDTLLLFSKVPYNY